MGCAKTVPRVGGKQEETTLGARLQGSGGRGERVTTVRPRSALPLLVPEQRRCSPSQVRVLLKHV